MKRDPSVLRFDPRRRALRRLAFAALSGAGGAAGWSAGASGAFAQAGSTRRAGGSAARTADGRLAPRVVPVASGLEHPWSLAFLPDGRMLVTERPGRLRVISLTGRLSPPLEGVPKVAARGQGGLLDVVLSPDFQRDSAVFLSYAEAVDGGARTAVARAEFADGPTPALRNLTRIF